MRKGAFIGILILSLFLLGCQGYPDNPGEPGSRGEEKNIGGLAYDYGDQAPTGFAPPWDIFTEEYILLTMPEEVMMEHDGDADLLVLAGSPKADGSPTDGMHLIWKDFYLSKNGQWSKHEFAHSQILGSGWIKDYTKEEVRIYADELKEGTDNYILGYVCTLTDGQWYCGCRNINDCGYWQIQSFDVFKTDMVDLEIGKLNFNSEELYTLLEQGGSFIVDNRNGNYEGEIVAQVTAYKLNKEYDESIESDAQSIPIDSEQVYNSKFFATFDGHERMAINLLPEMTFDEAGTYMISTYLYSVDGEVDEDNNFVRYKVEVKDFLPPPPECLEDCDEYPYLITVSEHSPTSDVLYAIDVAATLQAKSTIDGGGVIPVGTAKLFNDVNALKLHDAVTVAIYYGNFVLIKGIRADERDYSMMKSVLEEILSNYYDPILEVYDSSAMPPEGDVVTISGSGGGGGESIEYREIKSSEITDSDLHVLFGVTKCEDILRHVCGQPPMPKCDADLGCVQVMPQPKTYSNECYMKAEDAEFLYWGECEADPYCGDGTCQQGEDVEVCTAGACISGEDCPAVCTKRCAIDCDKENSNYRYFEYDEVERTLGFDHTQTGAVTFVPVSTDNMGFLTHEGVSHMIEVISPDDTNSMIGIDTNGDGLVDKKARSGDYLMITNDVVCGNGICEDSEKVCTTVCPVCAPGPDGKVPEACGECVETCDFTCHLDCEENFIDIALT